MAKTTGIMRSRCTFPSMTVAADDVTDSTRWRAGRAIAQILVGVFAALFIIGVVMWARSDLTGPILWNLLKPWDELELIGVLRESDVSLPVLSAYYMLLEIVVAAAGLVAASLILRGADSWFRLYMGVVLALWVTMGGAMSAVYRDGLGETAGDVAGAMAGLGWVLAFPIAYVFPDGRFVPRWTRWCAVAWALYIPYTLALPLFGHEPDPDSLIETAPLFVLFGTAAYAVMRRYRTTPDADERIRIRGVAASVALWFVVATLSVVPPVRAQLTELSERGLAVNAIMDLASYTVAALIPISISVAILRHRLYDIDVWINRTLVYGGLTAVVAVSYAATAALGAAVWPGNSLSGPLLGTVIVAVVLHPLRLRVQRAVDRFVHGRRREPYMVLTDLGRQLESVVPPDEVLQTLVRQIGTTLKLPYVAADLPDARATFPESAAPPPGHRETFEMRWQDEHLGALTVVSRPGDELGDADRELLDGLARQAGAAVRAATLNDDLRRSRDRILVAREDERRRLQRDLHDGLGPTLASLYQRVDAARSLLGRDRDAADQLLADVGVQTRAVIGDIRALVRALRPPELDELGLVGSLEAAAASLDGLDVDVTASDIATVPAIVEIAAYRIAIEALTNAVRHAEARHATIQLRTDQTALHVTVTDDGRGMPTDLSTGTGLRSMRERADELGGVCEWARLASGGTQVMATLPMRGRT